MVTTLKNAVFGKMNNYPQLLDRQSEKTNQPDPGNSTNGDIRLRQFAAEPRRKFNKNKIVLNKPKTEKFFTFSVNNVKIPERAKILWDILIRKIVRNHRNMTPQLFVDSVIEWDKLRVRNSDKHLQDTTLATGMKETTDSLLLLGYTSQQIGTKNQHAYFLTEFKRWIKIDKISNNRDLTPKLFPVLDPLVLNWTVTLVTEISIEWTSAKKLPLSVVPKPINTAAALVLLQLFTFLRAKELYFTSYSQAERCITTKTLKIKNSSKKVIEVPALVSYTNIRFHKTDYRGKFKTCPFVIATAEKKNNDKGRGPWNLTLMGHAIAILHARGKQVVNGQINWDAIVPPMRVGSELRPLGRREINEALKQLENTAGAKKGATTYRIRRTFVALLALHQVPRDQIKNCASWSDNKLVDIYSGENPLGAASKLRKVNQQIVQELLLHAAAKDAYKHIDPIEPTVPINFTEVGPLADYESDQDSDSEENTVRDNISKYFLHKS